MATLPRGIRNNNPLNLIRSNAKWLGMADVQSDPRFVQFKEMKWGIRAAIINMRAIHKRNNRILTYEQLINTWAPPSENNTTAYLNRVCRAINHNPADLFDPYQRSQVIPLIMAMSVVENGNRYFNEEVVSIAFNLVRSTYFS